MSETNQNTSLTQAINDMRTMRESYDQLGAAAEAYNTGKVELAQNITAKGVEASATETLPELAEKVAQIAQETTIYDGADSYGKQLSADGALWDLYQVLADMKTRFMGTGDYAALIVCEYYKGYPSLVLQGADGYYTCDGDYYDYASPNHVWHDADNGKMNRWVTFLYRNEGARLDITNTDISPRSMYIGGHIGTIEYFVNGRLTDLVCGIEDSDLLDLLNFGTQYTQQWSKIVNLRKVGSIKQMISTNIVSLNLEVDVIEQTAQNQSRNIVTDASYLHIKIKQPIVISTAGSTLIDATAAVGIEIHGGIRTGSNRWVLGTVRNPNLTFLYIYEFMEGNLFPVNYGNVTTPNLIDLLIGEADGNISSQWNPTNVLADADKKAQLIDNIKNHILARVSDATGSTQLVFTVSTNMYNAIASEQIEWQGETMSLADAFLTKNWLLAGA